MKSSHDTNQFLTVQSQAFNRVLNTSWIPFVPSYYSSVQNRFFNVENIKIILCHFLNGMDGHVIQS